MPEHPCGFGPDSVCAWEISAPAVPFVQDRGSRVTALTVPIGLEVHRRAERPHRSPVPGEQAADELCVVVLPEVEERVAIVAVDPDVTPGKDLEAGAGVPAEFGRLQVRVARSI